jgi:hypothetical protein
MYKAIFWIGTQKASRPLPASRILHDVERHTVGWVRLPVERMLEAVDDFTVGYGGEEENRDHRHPFTRGHGREGLQ